mmetsp:Transcript_1558/g.2206  ORF Transcript_1558/g.2206 Transcript_1558/m.2206 type:complete len:181 (+) Transcript_1558:132-674(+)|eukprot:CAMPEP_0198154454 /NCGR_PEP_ID=MMETSP1443-20131203/68599_1 /TAXON_ID=186043 /ORGANISM="Entomoneis sp., Strain CCMP2396" /LENGTH=180 /DNA_ID=CAMNT_0043821125 /DNA_START=161 /DNA_END=703 /DNA_ORIENTATION=-
MVLQRSDSESSPVSVMRWADESSTHEKDSGKTRQAGSRSLRFNESVEIFDIPHLNDTPDEDIYATWYSREEYSEIKSAYQLTIYMMESGEESLDDKKNHTSRGLEYRTQEGAWARYENKRDAYDAVLDEQDRQWKSDSDDDEKLREAYLLHSAKCARNAVTLALQDETDAKEIHDGNEPS